VFGIADKYLFFAVNTYQINDDQKSILDQVIQRLQDQPELKLYISGHTDDADHLKSKHKLSEKRMRYV